TSSTARGRPSPRPMVAAAAARAATAGKTYGTCDRPRVGRSPIPLNTPTMKPATPAITRPVSRSSCTGPTATAPRIQPSVATRPPPTTRVTWVTRGSWVAAAMPKLWTASTATSMATAALSGGPQRRRPAADPVPLGRGRGVGLAREGGVGGRDSGRPVQVDRGRALVLVHAGRADPEVRLALVPEDDDVVLPGVAELDPVSQITK